MSKVMFEKLEGRTMMAANPLALAVSTVTLNGQATLRVLGTTGNDNITLAKTSTGFQISNASWSTTATGTFASVTIDAGAGNDIIAVNSAVTIPTVLIGGAGNDTLNGGAGDDRIYDNAGMNKIAAGAGDDIIETIGQTSGTIAGNAGNDSFWTGAVATATIADVSTTEAARNVHRVSAFYGAKTAVTTASATAKVSLVDPTVTDASMKYKNFSDRPLFASNGPTADDITQGYIGDCYYLATLSSIAKVNANVIKQSIVDLGDGTYAVQFVRNGTKSYVRVDGDLPTWSWGSLAYANLGKQNSIWTALMEKAYAIYRAGASAYSSLNGGWMSNVYSDLGIASTSAYTASSASALINLVKNQLNAGMSVTFAVGTVPSGAPLIGSHAYMVDHVNLDANGAAISITLRNPWGVDGAGNDGANDGYVTISADVAFKAMLGMSAANVG